MIAYSLHEDGKTVFIEELGVSRTARGRKLQTGSRLIAAMLDKVSDTIQEIHLIVRKDNVHARALYERLGMTVRPWRIYQPGTAELYMVASYERIRSHAKEIQRCSAGGAHDEMNKWEMETADNAKRELRGVDMQWVRQIYTDVHGSIGRSDDATWSAHCAEEPHIILWRNDVTGVLQSSSIDATQEEACSPDQSKEKIATTTRQCSIKQWIHAVSGQEVTSMASKTIANDTGPTEYKTGRKANGTATDTSSAREVGGTDGCTLVTARRGAEVRITG